MVRACWKKMENSKCVSSGLHMMVWRDRGWPNQWWRMLPVSWPRPPGRTLFLVLLEQYVSLLFLPLLFTLPVLVASSYLGVYVKCLCVVCVAAERAGQWGGGHRRRVGRRRSSGVPQRPPEQTRLRKPLHRGGLPHVGVRVRRCGFGV